MKTTIARRKVWSSGLVPRAILIVSVGVIFGMAARAQGTLPPAVVNSPAVPTDVSIPGGFGGNPIAFFDDYSWRTFIALVWPGLKDHRGEPDKSAGVTVDGGGPRVFETYKALEEVFHNDGSAPSAWNDFDDPKFNPCNVKKAYGDVTLGSFSKFSNLAMAGFGTLLGPLIAQNTTYVRYLTAFNRVEFQKIVDNKWYLRSNLATSPGSSLTFDNGAIDVKSAWIDMTGIPHPERFYVRKAQVLDPVTGACSIIDVGLVGLHIVQKTPTRPQWIWSSFEHVDNVPPAVPGAPGNFTFNKGDGTPMPVRNPFTASRVLTPPTAPPFNVVRVKPIHPSTVMTNDAYHAALAPSSKWRFYQLVMTQWPLVPSSPSTDGDTPNTFPGDGGDTTAFSNTTMEAFEQRNISTGCMSCHNQTRTTTDFVWSLNDHAFPPSSATPNILMRNTSFRNLRDLLERARRRDAGGRP